jgi:hypothetical protein
MYPPQFGTVSSKSHGNSPVHRPTWGPKGYLPLEPQEDALVPKDGTDLPKTWLRPEPKRLASEWKLRNQRNQRAEQHIRSENGPSRSPIFRQLQLCLFNDHFVILSFPGRTLLLRGIFFGKNLYKIESSISLHPYISLHHIASKPNNRTSAFGGFYYI